MDVGAKIADLGADLVFGGAHVGLMGIVADAALDGGSHVIGVITEQLEDAEIAHCGLSELHIAPDMSARKQRMYTTADAFLTLPGGIGTMEEFFEVLTWGYLGLHPKPVALLNVSGYFDPLISFLDGAVDHGLCKPRVRELSDRRDPTPRCSTRSSEPRCRDEPTGDAAGEADARQGREGAPRRGLPL